MDENSRRLIAGASGAGEKTYIEDVFSTFLYTGNGSTQTITNGIDLSGKGGLVWIKNRSQAYSPLLFDTVRQAPNSLTSVSTNAQANNTTSLTSFTSSGFSVGSSLAVNDSSSSHVSWTFRKAAKFFDVVTWTGDGNASRQISHALGSTPGCAFIKRTDSTSNWVVHHRSFTSGAYVAALNLADEQGIQTGDNWSPSTTTFNVYNSVLTNWATNINGATYVAYLFAHDTTADGMIQCGSFSTDGSGNATVSLGWEPQWLLFKPSSTTGSWLVADSLRGLAVGSSAPVLQANSSSAESNMIGTLAITPTGFSASSLFATSSTYIYIAIRRGPMKTPTDATKVFDADLQTGGGFVTTNFPVDLNISNRPTGTPSYVVDRLRGGVILNTTSTAAEDSTSLAKFDYQTGFEDDNWSNVASSIYWSFRRAPGFFDVVAYTGTGSARTVSHNLGVAPELMIVKQRNQTNNWPVYSASLANNQFMLLNSANAKGTFNLLWNNTIPTSTAFSVGTDVYVNGSTDTYIAYLFASCPGVSKVGSYTGTGTTLQINCGFTNGARFVLIKRTDSTGDWYVWDTARGIVSANDPYLLLNSTAAEVTNTDYIDPYAAGFEISSTAPAAINANGGTYIYLAIA